MSHESEQCVLGGLLLDGAAWDRVADSVTADDFARREHRLIFNAIAALVSDGTQADVITVSERLERTGELEAAGGLAYLGSLANNTPSAANVAAYAAIVHDRAIERRLLEAAGRVTEIAKGNGPVRDKLDRAQALVMGLAETRKASGPRRAEAIVPQVLNELDRRHKAGGGLVGLPTGFTDLDAMTSGLQAGDLVVVAGRPSSGKTSLAMNLAEHIAGHANDAVLIFSLEMSAEQLLMRSMTSLGRLDFQHLRAGKLDESGWSKVATAASRLADLKLLVDDSAALSVTEVRTRARRVKREHGLSLVVVDYLQLMRGEGENRNHEVAQISAGLKALAKELHVPVVVLSQLNRSVESRTNKRPQMSDLRDSGAVEQDADVILFIYRDEVYHEDSPAKGTAEIIIGKQRNGPTGMVRLAFNGALCRFDNYAGSAVESRAAKPKRWSGGFGE